MKSLFIIIAVTTVSCCNKQPKSGQDIFSSKIDQDTVVYLNNDYKMTIYSKDEVIYDFKLYNIKTSVKLNGTPELILVDGEIPEGSLREDHNNPNDYREYECDSAYQYAIEKIKVAFALEKGIKKRLDLVIYDSDYKDFINGGYTLVKQSDK
ncbi:hypothetical protein [Sphingobacterium sp. LRF_L2]|uniref:hypothetical protein n=1 Tax=Sphingobacterium sp. LRF_L2 TaxID=3369421 RepID=UPI003F63225E